MIGVNWKQVAGKLVRAFIYSFFSMYYPDVLVLSLNGFVLSKIKKKKKKKSLNGFGFSVSLSHCGNLISRLVNGLS
jgi:hypothetical protein